MSNSGVYLFNPFIKGIYRKEKKSTRNEHEIPINYQNLTGPIRNDKIKINEH